MQKKINHKLALEMAMQDVMDNLEELAYERAFQAGESCFEILAIEATQVPDRHRPTRQGKQRDIFAQQASIIRLKVA